MMPKHELEEKAVPVFKPMTVKVTIDTQEEYDALQRARESLMENEIGHVLISLSAQPGAQELEIAKEKLKATAAKLQQQIEALEKPKQWEPRGGDWSIRSNGQVDRTHGNRGLLHKQFGEMRLTQEAAEKASDAMRIHNRLLAYVDEFGDNWEADWYEERQEKSFVFYVYRDRLWALARRYTTCASGTVYMSRDCALGLVAKLNSGEVVL